MTEKDCTDVYNMIPVIQDIMAMVTPVDEIKLVKEANALMVEKAARREQEDEKTRAELKALANALASARQSCVRPNNVPSEAKHLQTIKNLDDQRFSLVKAIEEGESALNAKEAEYAELKAELRDLEGRDATESVELDGDALRLNLYRELGFEWVEDTSAGEQKIIIRTENDDVHVVTLDGSKSAFELTNLLWDMNKS